MNYDQQRNLNIAPCKNGSTNRGGQGSHTLTREATIHEVAYVWVGQVIDEVKGGWGSINRFCKDRSLMKSREVGAV